MRKTETLTPLRKLFFIALVLGLPVAEVAAEPTDSTPNDAEIPELASEDSAQIEPAAEAEPAQPVIVTDITGSTLLNSSIEPILANPNAALIPTNSAEFEAYGFFEQQIFRGEASSVEPVLRQIVSDLEQQHHRYHDALLVPLTLMGDALMVQQQYDAALDAYDRARHIARVSHGLFNPRQLPVVYREADAYRRLGDLANTSQREEYAFEVLNNGLDRYDPEILPGLERLGRFYLETGHYLSARSMYRRALAVHQVNNTQNSVEAISVLRGIARSHQLEKFPPLYITDTNDTGSDSPAPRLTTNDLDRQHIAFNNFPAGERALQHVVEIRKQQTPTDKAALYQAMLELADWHLLFERNNSARTLYEHVYAEMVADEVDAAAFFATPVLLHFPIPRDPRPPAPTQRGTETEGLVELSFDVMPSGRIRKLKTVDSQPERLMDFRVRRSMRLAIYRPTLMEGMVSIANDHRFTHRFNYYPLRESESDPSADPGNEPGTSEPELPEAAKTAALQNATDTEATQGAAEEI